MAGRFHRPLPPIQVSGFRFHPSLRSFSLLELLVVLAIIVLIAGILLVAVARSRELAQRKQTAALIQTTVNAITQYKAVYGKFPGQSQSANDSVFTNNSEILSAIQNNPRNLPLLQVPESAFANGSLVDAWACPLVIAMDDNASGITDLTASYRANSISANVTGSVAIMSWGPDPEIPGKRIYSWAQ